MKIEYEVLKFIKKYNMYESGDRVLLGVSGGRDSMVMMDILFKLKDNLNISLGVAHFNHSLRKNADDEELFVKRECRKRSLPFYSKKMDVGNYAKDNKIGIEEAARKLRYEFFNEILESKMYNKIAIAHYSKDLSETIVYRLIKGTGIFGIGGVLPVYKNVTRPILSLNFENLEKYVTINNVKYIIDESNFDTKYSRNKIRHNILPEFQKINEKYEDAIFRFAEITWEYRDYLDKVYTERVAVEKNIDNKNIYKMSLKKDFFDKEILRMVFLELGVFPPSKEEVNKILSMKSRGKRKINNLTIEKIRNMLYISKEVVALGGK
ncbi:MULTISPECIES: tRNA lysidine(34) synthetase TilS [unclassified Marinitoga]|uniref:tRNA lysidine(34) synthetase TilS n=1 Tax=unclassified Marinitoga TaxID=2640159 RepID=UPI0006413FC2|nr:MULTISPECIES: tRNA lysidine(34) synthetase TilS [unclassified Marinitoga]KLO23896.1 tRNA(Ile)-lysidine synthase [Marinitoga sp. 1155]NUU99119.1 tRNA(Ile)-lysidine synthase [Marinitoga sp. 1154]